MSKYRGTHDSLPDPRNDDVLIYVNGELFRRNEAKISVFDSAFMIGDGVWEGIRLHNGKLAFVDEHLDRLFQGMKTIGLDLGMTREELTERIWETLRANHMYTDVHVRLMVTRGIKRTPSQDPRLAVGGPTVVIIAEHKRSNPETTAVGVRLFTSTIRRPPPDTLDPRLNSHSKLHEVIALVQAIQAGADEALMLDVNGHVATCNATNFFIVKKGEVWTSSGTYCMNGITRGNVIKLCRMNDIPVYERNFSLFDVYGADEAFVTGTFGALTPVTEIDGRAVSAAAGPVTTRLQELYAELKDEVARG